MSIQIVEDDRALSDGIRLALQQSAGIYGKEDSAGRESVPADFVQSFSIQKAKEDFMQEEPGLIILDINLPDGSGYDYLKWVRGRSHIPVLVLTANDMELDEVASLTLGADDYIAKPFKLAVLRARIEALLRRTSTEKTPAKVYKEDGFLFDFENLYYLKNGQEILLSVNEQKLLRLLVENSGRVLTRETLYDRLWSGGGQYVDENALSVAVNRLRSKLEDKNDKVKYISTVYGQGYTWKAVEK